MDRHAEYLRQVKKYIALHTENPSKARLRSRNELEEKETVDAKRKVGTREKDKYRFVELWKWKELHPHEVVDQARVVTKRLKKQGTTQGILERILPEGVHELEDYEDEGHPI